VRTTCQCAALRCLHTLAVAEHTAYYIPLGAVLCHVLRQVLELGIITAHICNCICNRVLEDMLYTMLLYLYCSCGTGVAVLMLSLRIVARLLQSN
jgi:hypothetical protein